MAPKVSTGLFWHAMYTSFFTHDQSDKKNKNLFSLFDTVQGLSKHAKELSKKSKSICLKSNITRCKGQLLFYHSSTLKITSECDSLNDISKHSWRSTFIDSITVSRGSLCKRQSSKKTQNMWKWWQRIIFASADFLFSRIHRLLWGNIEMRNNRHYEVWELSVRLWWWPGNCPPSQPVFHDFSFGWSTGFFSKNVPTKMDENLRFKYQVLDLFFGSWDLGHFTNCLEFHGLFVGVIWLADKRSHCVLFILLLGSSKKANDDELDNWGSLEAIVKKVWAFFDQIFSDFFVVLAFFLRGQRKTKDTGQ